MQTRTVLKPKQYAIPQGSVIFFPIQDIGYRLTLSSDKVKISYNLISLSHIPEIFEQGKNSVYLCTFRKMCILYRIIF